MTALELEQYCKDSGVPYRLDGKNLRVMDITQLPDAMRNGFDERGIYKGSEVEQPVVLEVPIREEAVEEEITTAKKRKK